MADRKVERAEDGGVEIAYRVGDVAELTRWVLGWGAQAEILAPVAARADARASAGRIFERNAS